MLVKILGIIDIILGIFLILASGIDANTKLLIFFGAILITKSSFGMLQDFGSWVDILCGAAFILLIFITIPKLIIIVLAVLLIQKGFFSLI